MALTAGKEWTYTIAVPSYNKGTGYVTFYFQEYYDIDSNASYIYVIKIMVNHSTYDGTYWVHASITADGVQVATLAEDVWHGRVNSTGTAAEVTGGTLPIISNAIVHNTDGTKAVTLNVTIHSLYNPGDEWLIQGVSGTQAVTLTTIPRASSVTCSGGDIGAAKTISISRASSAFTHTLTYAFAGTSGTIATKTASTAVSWTPPMELCSQIPDAASAECTITCQTYSGNTLIGTKTCKLTLRVPDSVKLTVSAGWATAAPYNDGTAAAGMAAYVHGYSKAQVTFDSSKISSANAYGASIASYKILHNNKSYGTPYRTDVLKTAGVNEITAIVVDSRGKETSEKLTVSVEAYTKPTLSQIKIFRCNSLGVATDEGTYISVTAKANISSVGGLNVPVMQLAIGNLMTEVIPDGETVVIGNGLVLSTLTYIVTLMLSDTLGNTAVYQQVIPTAAVFFHGRKGGKGAAFGKYAEADDLLEIAWGLKTKKDLTVEGDAAIGGALTVGGEVTIGGKTLSEIIKANANPLASMPVGYIYISVTSTSPASLFGGTWTQLKDRFLIGAGGNYAVNGTGGSATHTLTVNEMPSHQHSAYEVGYSYESTSSQAWTAMRSVGRSNHYGSTSYTANTGGGAAHNNMPPYLAVYMWKRTA